MIFVVGATGFVGASTAAWLEGAGLEVFRVTRGHLSGQIPLPAAADSVVVNCAWAGVAGDKRDSRIQHANSVLTRQVVEVANRVGAVRLVAFGSQAEYGPANSAVDELAPLSPSTAYGRAKVAAFLALSSSCAVAGREFVWLRLFDVYGPGDGPEWFLPYVIRSALSDTSPRLTKCEQRWDYLYVDDVCRAVKSVIEAPAVASGAYNLSSGVPVSLKDVVANVFETVAPPRARPIFGAVPYGVNQVMHLEGINERLSAATGWSATTGMREGIARTIEFERSKAK